MVVLMGYLSTAISFLKFLYFVVVHTPQTYRHIKKCQVNSKLILLPYRVPLYRAAHITHLTGTADCTMK